MRRIKIIERNEQLDEKTLTRYERQGLTLISVNRGQEKFSSANCFIKVTPWVYHFRIDSQPSEGSNRLPSGD